jgi:hypothetical protein
MSKTYGHVTERLLRLEPGRSCFVSMTRLCRKTLQKHLPGATWRTERREGGLLVTRTR